MPKPKVKAKKIAYVYQMQVQLGGRWAPSANVSDPNFKTLKAAREAIKKHGGKFLTYRAHRIRKPKSTVKK